MNNIMVHAFGQNDEIVEELLANFSHENFLKFFNLEKKNHPRNPDFLYKTIIEDKEIYAGFQMYYGHPDIFESPMFMFSVKDSEIYSIYKETDIDLGHEQIKNLLEKDFNKENQK